MTRFPPQPPPTEMGGGLNWFALLIIGGNAGMVLTGGFFA